MAIKTSFTAPEKKKSKASESQNDQIFEASLRPSVFDDFIGQKTIKSNLKVFIDGAKKRKECLHHTLLSGPPGLGKTTLAMIIAQEMSGGFKITSGPAIEKSGD